MPRGEKNRKLSDDQRAEIVRRYTTRLPGSAWEGSKMLAAEFGVGDGTIRYVLRRAGVTIRSAKEAHAHGKRCGPIKHTEQLGEPPMCACGCGQPTHWVRSKYRWAKYVRGHYRDDAPYKSETWLREQYQTRRRSISDISKECSVNMATVIKFMKKFGIARRTTKESLKGIQAGARNPAWKGGVTPERQRLYKTEGWKTLIKAVFARDGYACQRCKKGISGKSKRMGCAHHIKSFAEYPDLRTDMANLVTLCRACHEWVHSNANTARDFLS